jgi:hypothetical protein
MLGYKSTGTARGDESITGPPGGNCTGVIVVKATIVSLLCKTEREWKLDMRSLLRPPHSNFMACLCVIYGGSEQRVNCL